MESNRESPTPEPWWRMPIWWMVVGGPAVVVVAGLATAWVAMSAPDPVLDTRAPLPSGAAATAPAVQARNHAVTPAAPAASKP